MRARRHDVRLGAAPLPHPERLAPAIAAPPRRTRRQSAGNLLGAAIIAFLILIALVILP